MVDWGELFPAHAGVIPVQNQENQNCKTLPRPRGGNPPWKVARPLPDNSSPPTRG